MPRLRVNDRFTVAMNGTYFRIKNPVRKFISSTFPAKITIGDQSPSTHPLTSNWLVSGNARGGIGVEILDPQTDADRVWWTDCQIRFKNHLVLPRRPVLTAVSSNPDTVGVIIDMVNSTVSKVYATFGTSVEEYSNSSDSWTQKRTIAAAATDAVSGYLQGTTIIAIANGTDMDYMNSAEEWAENTTVAVKFLTFWRDKLWGITQAGKLYWTSNLTTWNEDAQLQLPDDYVTGLMTGPSPENEEIIYCRTKVGLYIHDVENQRFLKTPLETPYHPDGGKGGSVWRGAIYYGAGNAIYKYIPSTAQTVVTIVGPDRDSGLPSGYRGSINNLIPSHTDLVATVDAALDISAISLRATRGLGTHHGFAAPVATGLSSVLSFDELGWEVKWLSVNNAQPIRAGLASNAYSKYRLWWSCWQRVYYMDQPRSILNPSQVTDMDYDTAGTWISPWLDTQSSNETWTAVAAYLKTTNPTASETVKLEYQTDYGTAWTTLGTQSASADTAYTFPNNSATDDVGVAFKAIRFRMTLARGTTTTFSPDVIKLSLAFKKNLNVAFGYSFVIDMNEQVHGLTPAQQVDALNTILETYTLMDFTYRDENDNTQNFWVTPTQYTSLEETGHRQTGLHQLQVSELI